MSVYVHTGKPPQLAFRRRLRGVLGTYVWAGVWLAGITALVMATEIVI